MRPTLDKSPKLYQRFVCISKNEPTKDYCLTSGDIEGYTTFSQEIAMHPKIGIDNPNYKNDRCINCFKYVRLVLKKLL